MISIFGHLQPSDGLQKLPEIPGMPGIPGIPGIPGVPDSTRALRAESVVAGVWPVFDVEFRREVWEGPPK